jgi:Holliday junction resolvasome RuvABC DNA-binding subunit
LQRTTSHLEVRAGATETRAHVGAPTQSRLERTTIRTQALDALVGLGFKRHEARIAVDEAVGHFGDAQITLESFLRVALAKSRPRTG